MDEFFKICMKFLNSIKAMFRKRQANKSKQTSEQKLNRYIYEMDIHSQKGIAAQDKMRMMEDKLKIHNNSCPEFMNADHLQTLFYYIAIIVAVSVILSNYVFTSPAISNIANEYGNKNNWYSLIFPISLIVIELLSARLHNNFTQHKADEIEKIKAEKIEEENKEWQIDWCTLRLYVLRFVMGIMILISPMFLLATIITVDGFSSIQDSIKSSTFLALAVITDFLIVLGGVYICKSIAFILFHCNRWRIQRKIDKYQEIYNTSGGEAVRSFGEYLRALGQYNRNLQEYNQEYSQQNNPIPDLEQGPFNRNTITFVDEWLNSQENQRTFPPPQQPQDQFRATNTPPSNNPVNTNREEIDEPETEFNYLDLNIRDAEREVDGD